MTVGEERTDGTSFHCVVTQPLNYFSVWLKSLNRYTVYQLNLFPTAAQAVGLVTTLSYAWVSDALGGKRWQIMMVPATINFIGMVIVASGAGIAATFFGYVINAASWGLWPLVSTRPRYCYEGLTFSVDVCLGQRVLP